MELDPGYNIPELICPGGRGPVGLLGDERFVKRGLGLVLAGPVGNEQQSEGDCFWKERQLSHCPFLVCAY